MKNTMIFILIVVLLSACSSNHIVRYAYSFEKVKSDESDYLQKEIVFGRYRYIYSDKNIELLFDFEPYEIGIQVRNPGLDTLRIIWDDVYLETDYDPIQKFNLSHTNRFQETIALNDTTIENYEVLKLIKEQQLKDTTFIIRPTIILPGMSFSDVIVNKDKGYFLPYEMRDASILNNFASKMKDKNLMLHFTYKINSKLVNILLNLKVKDYYLLRKG